MSHGIIIPEVYLSGVHVDDIENEIEESNSFIQRMKEEIIALAAAAPRDIKDDEGYTVTWEDHVLQKINGFWDDLVEDIGKRKLMYIALEQRDELKKDY